MKTVIGYQIESTDGNHDIPSNFYSFEIFKEKEAAERWLQDSGFSEKFPDEWHVMPIHEGDIEEPSFIDPVAHALIKPY